MEQIFTFFGADHKCGVSMTAQCTAERIAQKLPQCSVLLLHAESGCGRDFAPGISESLDNIEQYISKRILDMDDVLRKSRYKDNLYILGGNTRIGSSTNYHPEMGEYLLGELQNCFPFIICDAGCNAEHGMALGALLGCSESFLVVSQSESAIRRYGYVRGLFDMLDYKFSKLIISKYDRRNVISKEMLAFRTGFAPEDTLCVSYSAYGADAEQDERSLLSYRDSFYIKCIDLIAGEIMERAGYGTVQD